MRTPGLSGEGFFTVDPEEQKFEYVSIFLPEAIKNGSFPSQIPSLEICSLVALWSNLRDLPIRFVTGRNVLYPASIG